VVSVFSGSLTILRRSVYVWTFAAVVVALARVTSLFDDIESPLICAAGVASLLSLAARVPLILAADYARRGLPYHARDLRWPTFTSLANVFVLSGGYLVLLVVFAAIWWLLRELLGLQAQSTLDWLLRVVFLMPLGQAIVVFSFCGFAISQLAPLKAATNALLIATNNLPRLILLVVPIEALTLLIHVVTRLLAAALSNAAPATPDLQAGRLPPLSLAAIWSLSTLGGVIVEALAAAIFVVAYSAFTREIEYPWLKQKAAA
jgi:hypothetical protein